MRCKTLPKLKTLAKFYHDSKLTKKSNYSGRVFSHQVLHIVIFLSKKNFAILLALICNTQQLKYKSTEYN